MCRDPDSIAALMYRYTGHRTHSVSALDLKPFRRNRKRILGVEPLSQRRLLAAHVVDTTLDLIDPDDGLFSLREAAAAAAMDTDPIEISFAPELSAAATAIIQLGGAPIEFNVSQPFSLSGLGRENLVIDAQAQSGVLRISASGLVQVSGLTIRGGETNASDSPGGGLAATTDGDIRLDDLLVHSNSTSGQRSGGGGLFGSGNEILIANSEFRDNSTEANFSGGGAIQVTGTLRMSDVFIHNNSTFGNDSSGGGVVIVGASEIENSTVSTNFTFGERSNGGGLAALDSVSVRGTTLSGNQTDLYLDPTRSTRGGNLYVAAGTQNAEIESSSLIGGEADFGGNLFVQSAARVFLDNSIIASGSADQDGNDIRLDESFEELNFRTRFSLIGDNDSTPLIESATADSQGNLIGSLAGRGVVDPGLGPLAVAGVGNPVHLPVSQSVVVDAGSNSIAESSVLTTASPDGRGFPFKRFSGQSIDIGAAERQPAVSPRLDWATPDPVTDGTQLTAEFFNARVLDGVTGGFEYSPAIGTTIRSPGQNLSAVFTPDDTQFFATATGNVFLAAVAAADYGDAPDSYLTSRSNGGPSHGQSSSGPRLGATISYESDAAVPLGINADTDVGDDGIVFVSSVVASEGSANLAAVQISVNRTTFLDAWIDFSGDGTFSNNEKLFGAASRSIAAGSTVLSFDIPAGATVGSSYARFRVSTDGGLGPGGNASDGEVEDYAIEIIAATSDQPVRVAGPGGVIRVSRIGDEVIIARAGTPVLRIPVGYTGTIELIGIPTAGVLQLANVDPASLPPITFFGGASIDTVSLIDGPTQIQLTATSRLRLRDIEAIDLTFAALQKIAVDADSLALMDPENDGVVVNGNRNLAIDVADPANFRMGTPAAFSSSSSRLILAKVITADSFLSIEQDFGYHNLIQSGDVNNDGVVEVLDALFVINALRRGRIYNTDNGDLDPLNEASDFPGQFVDYDNDGKIKVLDALLIINELRRRALGGEAVTAAANPGSKSIFIDEIRKPRSVR